MLIVAALSQLTLYSNIITLPAREFVWYFCTFIKVHIAKFKFLFSVT